MFAYCLNNPVNCYDSSGTVAISFCNGDRNPLFIGYYGCSGGGAGGYSYAPTSFCAEKLKKLKKLVENSSEPVTQEQLSTYGIGFYKGTMIIRVDALGTAAASFGVILMGGGNLNQSDFNDTLNHEYGHIVHLAQIGAVDYFCTTAIPSLIGAGVAAYNQTINDHYFDLPWERVADYLGGVDRGYAQGADTLGSIFWMYTLLASFTSPY